MRLGSIPKRHFDPQPVNQSYHHSLATNSPRHNYIQFLAEISAHFPQNKTQQGDPHVHPVSVQLIHFETIVSPVRRTSKQPHNVRCSSKPAPIRGTSTLQNSVIQQRCRRIMYVSTRIV